MTFTFWRKLSTRPQSQGNARLAPLWSAAAGHKPLCFRSSPVRGWQPLSGDRHGPDVALDRSCLITRVPLSSTGTTGREKRRRRGACGVHYSGCYSSSGQRSMASLSARIRPNCAALPARSKSVGSIARRPQPTSRATVYCPSTLVPNYAL